MSKTHHLENGISLTEGDGFFKNVPLQDRDGSTKYSSGEGIINHFSCISVPATDGTLVIMDHRSFNRMYADLMEQLESISTGDAK